MAESESYSYFPLPSAEDDRPDISVINPEFCRDQAVDLSIVRGFKACARGNFDISDADGNLLLRTRQGWSFFRHKIVLYDGAGEVPLVTLRNKVLSLRYQWNVYRGEGTEPKDLIFSVKRSSVFQFKTELDVFLANNSDDSRCDFKVKGSWFGKSSTVYAGNTDTVLARMQKNVNAGSIFLGKDNILVTVHPNVDHAFIAVLIVILDAINRAVRAAASSGGGGGGG